MPDDDQVGVAATQAPPGPNPDGFLGRLSELAWKALPAVGSAIGFVGFVAIIGGAIEWIRFDAADLPATQAVLAVPKQELVVIGALALGVFVIGAVLAVLVVYLIDSDGNATPRTAYGLIAVGVVEMSVTLFFIGRHSAPKYVWLGLWLILILFVSGYFVGLVMRDFRRRTKVKRAREAVLKAGATLASAKDAHEAVNSATKGSRSAVSVQARAKAREEAERAFKAFARAVAEWTRAAARVRDLQDEATSADTIKGMRTRSEAVKNLAPKTLANSAPDRVEIEAALDEAERTLGHVYRAALGQSVEDLASREERRRRQPERFTVGVLVGVLALGAIVLICTGFALLADEVPWAAILSIAIALLTAMNVFVARATDKFGLYGVAVFFSVLMFGAGLTIARTLHEPKVQPVALVRKDNEIGICGVYITQTSDRVYVGRLGLSGYRPGLIFWVPTSDVDLVSVGQPVRISDDGKRAFSTFAEHMLDRLYKDRAEEAAPVLKNKTISEEGKKPASSKQAKRISGLHVVTNTETHEAPPRKLLSKRHAPVTIDGKSCTATQEVVAAHGTS